jgi:phage shock protein C
MYCNACGKAIAEDVRFCSNCGNVVGIPPTPKKLLRSRANNQIAGKKIAGVCAGLAQYFDLDVTLVRILAIFLTLATGVCPGVVTYLLAWIIVPAEPELKSAVATQQPVTS